MGMVLLAGAVLTLSGCKPQQLGAVTLKKTDGSTLTTRDLRGKVTFVFLTGEGCGPCEAALPAVQRIAQSYPSRRVQVVAMEAWDRSPEAARALRKKSGLPTFTDDGTMIRLMGTRAVPSFMVIGRDGIVRHKQTGLCNPQVLEDAIHAALLDKKTVAKK